MPEESFNKAPATGSLTWLHALNGLLLAGLWAFAIGAYAGLPDQIPGHVGMSGVTRWDPKGSSPWFLMPILSLVSAMVLYGVATAATSGGAGMNIPDKDRFMKLPPEGRRYALAPMRVFLYGMVTWLLVLTGLMQWHMYRIAHAGPDAAAGGVGMLLLVAAMTGLVVAGAVYSGRRVRVRISRWETWSHAAGGAS